MGKDKERKENQKTNRTLGEKENYKYREILETDTNKQVEMRFKKKRNEYLRWRRKLLETNLYSRNLIKGINTWAAPILRCLGRFLKWTKEKLKQMVQNTRNLALQKTLYLRDDTERQFKEHPKRETESLLRTAQNITRTNYIKTKIDNPQQNGMCRLYGDKDEAINLIIRKCSKLAHWVYKSKHDGVGKVIHKELCKKVKFDYTTDW